MENSKGNGKTGIVITIALSCAISSAVTFFAWTLFLQNISMPSLLNEIGYEDSFVIKDPALLNDKEVLQTVGELVRDGTLLKLDDIWTFQSAFYQTIISYLVAIIGLLGIFAFVFIKNSSNDKAIEEAVKHTQTYLNSADFSNRLNNEAESLLKAIQEDYNTTVSFLDKSLEKMEQQHETVERLDRENKELKRYINIISQEIADNDQSEEADREKVIAKKEGF